ncbi:helix-turn-helix transcriptional regulator [Thioalkalivibrio sulfidiphilus]|uniref:helix-turn-helix transcriptional regulator n=1 Tax=Thioalkalivibrio sulfidiphilus TaxID=1033854 RepID=UPI003B365B75
MNRAERIYRIHGLLKGSRRPVPLARLMEELGASRATVVRDLAYMRDFMGAPLPYDRNLNGYGYDPNAPEFELPGLWFNASELYALLATEQLLESVQPGLLGPSLGPLKGRIRTLLGESGHSSQTVSQRVRLQPMAPRRVDDRLFGQVSAAVLESMPLHIEYHGRERDTFSQRRVHPYRLTHYRDNWYLIAWCDQANSLRTFSLDRIRQAEPVEGPLRPVDASLLDRYLGGSFGIFTGTVEHWAVLRFTSERARWVADENWHPDQIGSWDGDVYELQVPYSDPRELLMDILKYGPDVEVAAPASLRRQVAARLRAAWERYRGPGD